MTEPITAGTVLAGKYRVERVLGSGGMGMVVLAHHLQLDERVAIKLQLLSVGRSAETMARFAREARAAVKIKSEYVARVIDVGHLDSGAPYIVMEYLEGEDLAETLSRGPLALEQAVEFLLQACEALAEAHALGIIHRDIKPANLFCVRRTDGLLAIKLLDFGISRASRESELALTSSGVALGSPQYMAPEQMIAAKNADERSDIWSLGAVLFELLVGEPPFNAETFAALVLQVTTADPEKLAARLRGNPVGLVQIVLRCLNVEAALRYSSVSELAVALAAFGPTMRGQVHADRILRIARASHHPSLAPPELSKTESADWLDRSSKTLTPFGRTRAEGWSSTRRVTRIVVGGVGLLVLVGGWWWLSAHQRTVASADSGQNALIPTSAPLQDLDGAGSSVPSHFRAASPPSQLEADGLEVTPPEVLATPAGPSKAAPASTQKREARPPSIDKSPAPERAPPSLQPDSPSRASETPKTASPGKPDFGGRL